MDQQVDRRNCPSLGSWCGGLDASPYLAALDKVDGRTDDHQVALFDPVVYFHLRAQIARNRYLADMRRATLDHGDLQSVLIENGGIGGGERRRSLSRDASRA